MPEAVNDALAEGRGRWGRYGLGAHAGLGWYRKLIARKFDGSKARRGPGRPRIKREVEELIIRMPTVILFGERSLRRALSDYVEHFHAERNHQGKGNVVLFPRATDRHREGPVRCRERLGGLLRYYHQEAM